MRTSGEMYGKKSSFSYFSSNVKNGVDAVRKETAKLLKMSKLETIEEARNEFVKSNV